MIQWVFHVVCCVVRRSYMSFFEKNIHVKFEDILLAFSNGLNLVDTRLAEHHTQVAYICYEIGHIMELDTLVIKELIMLGLVHDIGAFKERERSRMLEFEADEEEDMYEHSIMGYILLRRIKMYEEIAESILYHHTSYLNGDGFLAVNAKIAMLSQIIFLADRISVLVLSSDRDVMLRIKEIVGQITSKEGELFNPEYVEAFKKLSNHDYFWLNITTRNKENIIRRNVKEDREYLDYETFMAFTKMFMFSIDFRSRFTSTHSRGVAEIAKYLAIISGMDEDEADVMEIAGYYHDIGKLMVPCEILNKPGKLTPDEYSIIRQHPYYTYYILESIKGMEAIRDIAAYHHELSDGNGYPFGLKNGNISKESKILTVADIFTALTEKRSYRDKIDENELIEFLEDLVEKGKIDKFIAKAAISYCSELYELNQICQAEVLKEFEDMEREKKILLKKLRG